MVVPIAIVASLVCFISSATVIQYNKLQIAFVECSSLLAFPSAGVDLLLPHV